MLYCWVLGLVCSYQVGIACPLVLEVLVCILHALIRWGQSLSGLCCCLLLKQAITTIITTMAPTATSNLLKILSPLFNGCRWSCSRLALLFSPAFKLFLSAGCTTATRCPCFRNQGFHVWVHAPIQCIKSYCLPCLYFCNCCRCWVPHTQNNTCVPGETEVACRDLKEKTGKMFRSPFTCCNELHTMMTANLSETDKKPKPAGGVCTLWTLQGHKPEECYYVSGLVSLRTSAAFVI